MSKYFFTRVSRNRKTGPIPVVTASKDTCPTTCPLVNNGCYAETGPIALVWQKCKLTLDQLCAEIRRLPKKQLWRYGQAGDLPSDVEIEKLVAANAGRPVLCYTHKRDVKLIREATAKGFHINISADDVEEADKFAQQGLSTVVVLPSIYGRAPTETLSDYKSRTSKLPKTTRSGIRIAVCPATFVNGVSCATCGVCAHPRKKGTIIGFPAHGTRKSLIDRRVEYGLQKRKGTTT